LTSYLETKWNCFPRFYFVSNDDLLDILGSSKPTTIQSHLIKLFDNCKSLKFEKQDKHIVGMVSEEGESFNFETLQKPEGNVEDWMNRVDDEMKKTLHIITKIATYNYAKEERIKWI